MEEQECINQACYIVLHPIWSWAVALRVWRRCQGALWEIDGSKSGIWLWLLTVNIFLQNTVTELIYLLPDIKQEAVAGPASNHHDCVIRAFPEIHWHSHTQMDQVHTNIAFRETWLLFSYCCHCVLESIDHVWGCHLDKTAQVKESVNCSIVCGTKVLTGHTAESPKASWLIKSNLSSFFCIFKVRLMQFASATSWQSGLMQVKQHSWFGVFLYVLCPLLKPSNTCMIGEQKRKPKLPVGPMPNALSHSIMFCFDSL